ncbi:MAG: redox-sensing transcriptional repressor Rex [Bacteroidota bacterium]
MKSADFTRRLLTYRLSLTHLKKVGLSDIYSHLLASETGHSASLIRKDMSRLQVKGKRRGGYDIDIILQAINAYFGNKEHDRIILAGMGNIGKAIIQNKDFEKHNIQIIASFDLNPAVQRKKFSIPVFPMEKCREIVINYKIDVAILAVPAFSAQSVCDQLIQCGIRGIMNFAPVNLKVPGNVYVSNVQLVGELQQVIYHTKQKRKHGEYS